MTAYQTTVTTVQGRQPLGHVMFASESFEASKKARQGVAESIGTETVKL